MRFLSIIKYAALLFIIVCVVLIAALIWDGQIPSDGEVLRQFNRDNSILVKLRDKFLQEPASIVGITQDKVMFNDTSNWISPEKAGFSDSHFLEYRVLMDKAHIKELWLDQGVINFKFAGFGIAGSGWRLSFAYTKTPPSSLIPSIDSLPKHYAGEPSPEYRALGNNWYMRIYY
jgi:hypothetical protein